MPSTLDIAASRSENRVYLHVLNLDSRNSVEASFAVTGEEITGGHVLEIAAPDLRAYVNQDQPDTFRPVEKQLTPAWHFPPASVSAVVLDLKKS